MMIIFEHEIKCDHERLKLAKKETTQECTESFHRGWYLSVSVNVTNN